ncbi:MAG: hypothetical protein KC912_18665 [Proteobacteria bacterium]|nr:hypothetical protein [Pseudomonadota bacterium]
MITQSTVRRTLLLGLASLVVLTQDAHAYLDPGTGSLILQGALAAIFGSMFFLRQTWATIVAKFKGEKPKPEIEEETSESES